MPIIHVIYDPRDSITARPEDLKRIGAAAISMRLNGPIDKKRSASIVSELLKTLVAQIVEEDEGKAK